MEINKLEDFISQMPKELPDVISKARYLYLELGKRSFYDRNIEYFMFGEEESNLMYNYKPYKNPNLIVCTTLIKQYQKLLTMANIKSKIVLDKYKHSSLVFEDEYDQEHTTDLTNDLKNIQFKCSTTYFAPTTISSDLLRKIDLNLGYISPQRGYSNEYWHILKGKLINSTLSTESKLEITLQALKEFGDLSKLGKLELYNLYTKFIKYCMDGKANIHYFSTKLNNAPEEYFIELIDNGFRIQYKLNRLTLEFEKFSKTKEDELFK